MINLVLAVFVVCLAAASEVLAILERKRQARFVGGQVRLSTRTLALQIVRPILAGVIVWFVAAQVEKAGLARDESRAAEFHSTAARTTF